MLNTPFKSLLYFLSSLALFLMKMLLYTAMLITPLGFYILLVQFNKKKDALSGIMSKLPQESKWQFVFKDTVIVTTNPDYASNKLKSLEHSIEKVMNSTLFKLVLVAISVSSVLYIVFTLKKLG